jgi:hypothetical protein
LDLKSGTRDCLDGMSEPNDRMSPKGVKRVTVSSCSAWLLFTIVSSIKCIRH